MPDTRLMVASVEASRRIEAGFLAVPENGEAAFEALFAGTGIDPMDALAFITVLTEELERSRTQGITLTKALLGGMTQALLTGLLVGGEDA